MARSAITASALSPIPHRATFNHVGEKLADLVVLSQDPAQRFEGQKIEEGQDQDPVEGHGNRDVQGGQGDTRKVWRGAAVCKIRICKAWTFKSIIYPHI